MGTELQPTHKQSSLTYMKVDLVDIEGEDIVVHLPACIDFIDKGRVTGKCWGVGFRSCRWSCIVYTRQKTQAVLHSNKHRHKRYDVHLLVPYYSCTRHYFLPEQRPLAECVRL